MTIQEVVSQLDSLSADDPEAAHGNAEGIICAYLRSNGAEDVANAFDRAHYRIGFWYA